MFWLDPNRGPLRRALLKELVGSATRDLGDAVGVAQRDLQHRAQGVGSRIRSRLTPDEGDDTVLVERVRSALGRVVSHPKAIDVSAVDGRVRLKGAVLAEEHRELLDVVCSVRGVQELSDDLTVYDGPRGIPELQGGRPRRRRRFTLRGLVAPRSWSPAARLVAGACAGSIVLLGLWQLFGPHGRDGS
jgi:hypothetical protein